MFSSLGFVGVVLLLLLSFVSFCWRRLAASCSSCCVMKHVELFDREHLGKQTEIVHAPTKKNITYPEFRIFKTSKIVFKLKNREEIQTLDVRSYTPTTQSSIPKR